MTYYNAWPQGEPHEPDFVHDIPERGEYIGIRRARKPEPRPPIVDLREPKPANGLVSCDPSTTHYLLMCPAGHAAKSDSNLDKATGPVRCRQCKGTYTWSYLQTDATQGNKRS